MKILPFLFPLLLSASPGDECFRLYYGAEKDLTRARVCFEAAMPQQPCRNGSSPDLPRMYLAVMYMDGQGGPVNYPGARSLFTGCFQDIGVDTVLKRISAPESGKELPKGNLDFCRDIGGSTVSAIQCNQIEDTRRSAELAVVTLQIRDRLNAKETALFDAAQKAWETYVTADAARAYDDYRGGTIAPVIEGESQNAHTRARTETLRKFPDYRPGPAREADDALNAAYQKLWTAADAEHRKLLTAAERAWIRYRDAEAAFYSDRFGPLFGPDAVAADVKASLTVERTKELSSLAQH